MRQRSGKDLQALGDGLADLFAGDYTEHAEAASMVLAEALAIYIRSMTEK